MNLLINHVVCIIGQCEEPGDVLLFLTGEVEIEDACRAIRTEIERSADPTKVHLFLLVHAL
ncbi:unnamed protein product, partial [Discosporangium mesarthrocarpum]